MGRKVPVVLHGMPNRPRPAACGAADIVMMAAFRPPRSRAEQRACVLLVTHAPVDGIRIAREKKRASAARRRRGVDVAFVRPELASSPLLGYFSSGCALGRCVSPRAAQPWLGNDDERVCRRNCRSSGREPTGFV